VSTSAAPSAPIPSSRARNDAAARPADFSLAFSIFRLLFTAARRFAEKKIAMKRFAKQFDLRGYSMWHICPANDAVTRIRS
jgi:hypothetical protein